MKDFRTEITADGSLTFFSPEFGELFHSHYGARQESFLKFIAPTQLISLAQKSQLRLLDICYGLGYNTAAALETIWSVNPHCCVEVIGLELDVSVAPAAIAHHLFDNWNSQYLEILTQLAIKQQVCTDTIKAKLLIGDARVTLQQVYQSGFQAEAIFLDPFSPPSCPQLWTKEFINLVSQCLHVDGSLATYSCAAAVRTALLAAGLEIASTTPLGRRTPGTVARHVTTAETPNLPLTQKEIEHLLTRAAIPYRDPELQDSPSVILQRRIEEQETSSHEPTSQWQKRWMYRKR